MNCAPVTLTGGGGAAARRHRRRGTAFSARPGIFIANVGAAGGGCKTQESFDVVYPEPGPDVVNDSQKPKQPDCGVTQNAGSGSGSGSTPPSSGGAGGGAGSGSQSGASNSARYVNKIMSYFTLSFLASFFWGGGQKEDENIRPFHLSGVFILTHSSVPLPPLVSPQ